MQVSINHILTNHVTNGTKIGRVGTINIYSLGVQRQRRGHSRLDLHRSDRGENQPKRLCHAGIHFRWVPAECGAAEGPCQPEDSARYYFCARVRG